MILLHTTLPHPDIPPGPNETGGKGEITVWPIEDAIERDAMARMDKARS